jgi:hypothetical protein
LTLGVPLATATLLDEPGDGDIGLTDLAWLDFGASSELNRELAREKVIEVVAKRFIQHLERRPDDFRDVAALALLLRANEEVLRNLWECPNPRLRLRELTDRYTLLSNGDLHPTVRTYLRQHWRIAPPSQLPGIAKALELAHSRTKGEGHDILEASPDWDLERLNLLSWMKGEDAYPEFARSLVVFSAFGEDVEDLRSLACEIKAVGRRGKQIHSMLESDTIWYFSAASIPEPVLSWLEREVLGSGNKHERACLDLVRGLHHNEAQRYEPAVFSFQKGFEYFGNKLPRIKYFAAAYFRAAVGLKQNKSNAAQQVLRWCDEVGFDPEGEWNHDFYWVLHNSAEYTSR